MKKFESFDDISRRVSSVKNPKESVVIKIKEELSLVPSKRKHKYYLFTRPPRDYKRR